MTDAFAIHKKNLFLIFQLQHMIKNFPKISLTGDLGSGKSHVSRLLSEKLA